MDNWKPNKWIAGILGLLLTPIAMLYLNKRVWAIIYTMLLIGIVGVSLFTTFVASHIDLLSTTMMFIGGIHAFILASLTSLQKRPWYTRWYSLMLISLLFLMILYSIRAFLWEPFSIPANSMAPSFPQGTVVLVDKRGCGNYGTFGFSLPAQTQNDRCRPQRGDVFAFQYPKDPQITYMKRIIGISGDTITYDTQGVLTVNEQTITQKDKTTDLYTVHTHPDSTWNLSVANETLNSKHYDVLLLTSSKNRRTGQWTVPADHYFVLGDNRDMSNDSRMWGVLSETHLIGRVIYPK